MFGIVGYIAIAFKEPRADTCCIGKRRNQIGGDVLALPDVPRALRRTPTVEQIETSPTLFRAEAFGIITANGRRKMGVRRSPLISHDLRSPSRNAE